MRRLGNFLFTSESVTEGHPDKMADQISDAILDCLIGQDPNSRVAVETLTTTGLVMISGEVTTNGYCEFPEVVRETVRQIGYTRAKFGFDCETCGVISSIHSQSPDIAQGVDTGGAGDQGMMFGFASNETPTLLPAPIYWAHRLSERLTEVRKTGVLDFLRPDGKTAVAFEYENGKPVMIDTVVIAAQHNPDVSHADLSEAIAAEVVHKTLPEHLIDKNTRIFINTTGRFVIGGPMGDAGVTGRKIIQDTYGGMGGHGGGALSGKDPSKVDRSAAYMARYIAKNIVAAGLAPACEIQIAYAIGVAEPISVIASSRGLGEVPDEILTKAVREVFDMRPYYIIKELNLKTPIYGKTTCYGHFGRELPEFRWEQTDKADALKAAIKRM